MKSRFLVGSAPYQIISDLLKQTQKKLENLPTNKRHIVIRGEVENFPEPLTTSYARNSDMDFSPDDLARSEWDRIKRWNNKMRQNGQNDRIRNNWELIVEAQHYGLNTRLLDWTYNPLMALWIACDGHARSNSGKSYSKYFCELEREKLNIIPNGAVYVLSIPHKPVKIEGYDGKIRVDDKRWQLINLDGTIKVNFDNPILASEGNDYENPMIDDYIMPRGHSYYEVGSNKHIILFFELDTQVNPRVKAQSGLFSIHSPAYRKFEEKGNWGNFDLLKLKIKGSKKQETLEYLETVLNCNAESFNLITPELIAKQINE